MGGWASAWVSPCVERRGGGWGGGPREGVGGGVAAVGGRGAGRSPRLSCNGNGNFGIGKNPSYRLDVSGNSWVDGDITINTTNPVAKTGGKVTAREILLIDPQTGASTTLDATSAGGVSRAKVYFHSFN